MSLQFVGVLVSDIHKTLFYLQLKDDTHPIKQFRNCYAFFGGGIEEGETATLALSRELEEELEAHVAEKILKQAHFLFIQQIVPKFGPNKNKVCEYTLFESCLTLEELQTLAVFPIKEGKAGILVLRKNLKKVLFLEDLYSVLDRYLSLNLDASFDLL